MNEQSIFLRAIEIPEGPEREAMIEQACGKDSAIARRVRALIVADQSSCLLDVVPHLPHMDSEPSMGPLPYAWSLAPGTVISDRFRINRLIGHGGMGEVYSASQFAPIHRSVAIKVLKARFDSPARKQRFESERQTLAMMDHPNIARVFDGGITDDNIPYFVMELVEGIPISDYCDQNSLAIKQRLKLFLEACAALQHAHQKGIIHRDIKPTNILVAKIDNRPVVKIIDFGLAKTIDQNNGPSLILTGDSVLLGTPLYMSPEQVAMSLKDVDTRSDVYSLGVVLYELICGLTPITPADLRSFPWDEILRRLRESDVPLPSTHFRECNKGFDSALKRKSSISHLNKMVRGDLDWITMKALAKEPSHRYDSVRSFSDDIFRFLNHEPVSAGPPTWQYRLSKFLRRNRREVILGSIFLLILSGTTVVSLRQAWVARQQRDRSVLAEDRLRDSNRQLQEEVAKANSFAEERDRYSAQAKEQLLIVSALNEFLSRDLLSQANPTNEPDRNVTLRSVLERASSKIDDRFSGQPAIAFELHKTMGGIFFELGEFNSAFFHFDKCQSFAEKIDCVSLSKSLKLKRLLASTCLEKGEITKAVEILVSSLGSMASFSTEEDLEDTVEGWLLLAEAHRRIGKLEAAEADLKDANQLIKTQDVPNSRIAMLIEFAFAKNELERPSWSNAESIFRKLVAENELNPALSPKELLSVKTFLATAMIRQGNAESALELQSEILETSQSLFGADHPQTLVLLVDMCQNFVDLGQINRATPLITTAIEKCERVLGKRHKCSIMANAQLAKTLLMLKQYPEASRICQSVVESRTDALGPNHLDTLRSMADLADALAHQNQFETAISILQTALDRCRETFGPSHFCSLVLLSDLGGTYLAAGQFPECIKISTELLEQSQSILGGENPNTYQSAFNLAKVHLEGGDAETALRLTEIWLGKAESSEAISADVLMYGHDLLGSIFEQVGQLQDAESHMKKVLNYWTINDRDQLQQFAPIAMKLGRVLLSQHRLEDAKELLEQSVAIRKMKEPNEWTTYENLSLLGENKRALGENGMGETELLEAHKGLRERESQVPSKIRSSVLAASLHRLIRLYEDRENPERTAFWKSELDLLEETHKVK